MSLSKVRFTLKLVFRLIWRRTKKIRKGWRIPPVNQKLPAYVSSNKGRSYRSPPTKNIYKILRFENYFQNNDFNIEEIKGKLVKRNI